MAQKTRHNHNPTDFCFLDFRKSPSPDFATSSLAASRPKNLAPLAKKLVRSTSSKSTILPRDLSGSVGAGVFSGYPKTKQHLLNRGFIS